MEIKSVNKERQKSQNKEIETLRSQLHEANFEEMEKIGTELNTVKVTLMQLEQSKAIADGQIEDLDKEILDLRRKLQDSQQQGDELFALKTQV